MASNKLCVIMFYSKVQNQIEEEKKKKFKVENFHAIEFSLFC